MRLSVFLFFCFTFTTIAGNVNSQNATVTINKQNVTIREILNEIETQTNFLFLYNKKNVNVDKVTTVTASGKTVTNVLAELFNGTDVSFTMEGKHIVLKKAESLPASTQQAKRIVKGVVNDSFGPIAGANVVIKGTTIGNITDMDGQFSIEVPANALLQISYIGYRTQEVSTTGKNQLTILLEEDSEMLDEVVVVGYGTVKKKDLTGAVASLKGDDIAARKTTQLSTALQGAIAGVMVTRDNGAPGAAAASIRVRGVTTIGDTSPLVIIDGTPGSINDVNPNDVESMSVLKDAASASIYGSRAAAGVILITTKRAKENDLSLSYQFEYGFEIPTTEPLYVGIERYLQMSNELRYNDNSKGGMFQAYSEDQQNNWRKNNLTDSNKYPITDWVDMIMRSSAPRQSHTISLAGGSKAVKTNASFTYDKIDGLYSDLSYERFMIRVNNDFKINKYIGATIDINFKRSKDHSPDYNPLGRMRSMPAVYAAVWDDGRIAEGKSGANPYGQMKYGGTQDEWYNRVAGQASLYITPIEGLKISGVIAPTYNFNKTKEFRTAATYTLADDPNTVGGNLEGLNTTKLTEKRNDNYNVTIQGLANYTKTFGKHDLNLMAGYETYYSFWENLSASRDLYEITNFPYLDLGPQTIRDNSGNAQELSYRSFFGRAMYSYDNRYMVQANIRHDGSSRFHEDYRWGTFPSVSGGWVISEEAFMKDQQTDWLSFLKLRASWGTLGNERILDSDGDANYYPYQAALVFRDVLFYQNGQLISQPSAAQQYYAIKNISWEKTQSFDIGLDASFLNNRLRFTFDYYKKTTNDMLLALEIPDYVGFDNPQKNTGKMHTNGYDIEVGWNDRVGDFNYSVSVNMSDFISKMGDLGGTQFLGDKVKFEGSQFNEWYGYLSDGLFLTEKDLADSPKLSNTNQIGDIKYKDVSGPEGVPDGKISPEYDRVLLGGSLPRYMFGGNIQLGYKGLDLSLAFQGVGSQNVRMSSTMVKPLPENYGNIPGIIDGNYWSSLNTEEQNTRMFYPRLTNTTATQNYTMSDYWMFNGRYVRLKNITLGYTLPKSVTEKILMKNARIYISANDLFCISQFPEGWDPEMGSAKYPITTSLLFGLSVNF